VHQYKQTCQRKGKAVCRFHFHKPSMKKTQILLPLEECNRKSYEKVAIMIFEQLVKMDLREDITYIDFINRLDLNEDTYIMDLCSTLKRPMVIFKWNVIDIRTNVFGRFVGPLWQANTDAQFILDTYAIASYCTSYLTKVDKMVTTKMETTLEKCKYEQASDVERIKEKEIFFECSTNVYAVSYVFSNVHTSSSCYMFISIYKYFRSMRYCFHPMY
jgi:hypothetical protein